VARSSRGPDQAETLQDYRHLIDRHVGPHIGELRLQAIRAARITKLYRDLLTSGGRDGGACPRARSNTYTRYERRDDQHPIEQLPHARLHDLRHVHATTSLLAGVPVHVVAARLGHAAPSITLRVYAHVISEQLAEAADIFARAIATAS
jgi:integrase